MLGHHFNTESQESRHCILDIQILPRVGSDPPKRLTVGPRRNDNTTISIKPFARIIGLQHAQVQHVPQKDVWTNLDITADG